MDKGAFNNYVDQFWPNFDPLPPSSGQAWTFGWPPSPSSCPRSCWMPPYPKCVVTALYLDMLTVICLGIMSSLIHKILVVAIFSVISCIITNTGCGIFRGWIWIKFWLKINCSEVKLLNSANWCNGDVSKSAKIWHLKSIFYVKIHPNLFDFFSLKNKNLGAHFLLSKFFDKINF